MDYQTFKKRLKECNLTIKEFAEICGVNPNSISTTWKKSNTIPKWAEALIECLVDNKALEIVKDKICKGSNNE